MTEERFKHLLNGWLDQNLSPSEIDELLDDIGCGANRHILLSRMEEDFSKLEIVDEITGGAQKQQLLEKLLLLTEKESEEKVIQANPVRRFRWGWAAAAVLLIGLAVPYVFYSGNQNPKEEEEGMAYEIGMPYPAQDAAVIVLPDQTRIRIDTITETIALDKYGIKISKLADGQIAYTHIGGVQPLENMQAEITNPRGSKPLSVRLGDNSVIWINAESTLQYPIAFGDDVREVSLSGEGYFEVAKDPARKFLVHTDKLTVEVIGTHFNVRSYGKEANPSVTLLEGSVHVVENKTHKRVTLKPNQQVKLDDFLNVESVSNANDLIVWKGGLLSFVDADLTMILENLGRAYSVDFQLTKPVSTKQYSGTISQNTTLTETLQIISAITGAQFQQKDKIIIVSEQK